MLPSLETGLLPQGGDVNLDDIVKQEEEIERNEAEEDTEQDRKDETEKQELIEHDKEFQDTLSEEEGIGVKNSKIRNSKSITTTPVLPEQRTKKKKHKLKRDEEIRSLELSSKCLEPTMDDDEFTSLFLKKRRQKVTAACDEEGLFVHNFTFTWPFHTAAIGVCIRALKPCIVQGRDLHQ